MHLYIFSIIYLSIILSPGTLVFSTVVISSCFWISQVSFSQTYVSHLHFIIFYKSPKDFQKQQYLIEVLRNSLPSVVIKKWNLTKGLIVPKTVVLSVCPLPWIDDLPLVCCCSVSYLQPSRRGTAVPKCNLPNLPTCVKLWGSGHWYLLCFSALTAPSFQLPADSCRNSWGKYPTKHTLQAWKRSKCLFI